MIRIPISSSPNQEFTITLPYSDRNRQVKIFAWENNISKYWEFTMRDMATNTDLITAMPLVPCQDMLEQYQYLKLGHLYLVNIGDAMFKEFPITENIATFWYLVWQE